MTIMKFALGLACAAAFAPAAQAQVAVSADLGTTGAGAYLILPMERTLNGRFGLHYMKRSKDQRAADVSYDTRSTLRTADILFDWYAYGASPLHLTAGLVYHGNQVTAVARPGDNGSYTINGKTYTAADVGSLTGSIEFRRAAPYLGIGWGNPLAAAKNKWTLTGDVGVFVLGPPKVKLVSLGCTTSQVVCRALATDVAADRARFKDDIDYRRAYPVLRVGAAYRF